MKSKFAKFTDATLGTLLVFFGATAVFLYFTPKELAVFCGFTLTACAVLLLRLKSKKHDAAEKLTKAANAMFFDFMFLSDDTPAKLLYNKLKRVYPDVVRHGGGVFAGSTAAYCLFDVPPDKKQCARCIAKAKRYGATGLVIISKRPPDVPEVDGITVKTAVGNDAYTLMASLGALPEKKFGAPKKRTLGAFAAGALGKDKILRYAVLGAAFFFTAWLSRSAITFACAVICTALAAVCTVRAVILSVKHNEKERNEKAEK